MNIIHIITGLPKSAGTTTFVENVVREQRTLGHAVDIVTNANQKEFFNSTVHSKLSNQTQSSTVDLLSRPTFSLIHIHGLWSPLLHRSSCYAACHSIPVIWSTHGMTATWSLRHKWWKKCLPWYLYQKPDLKRAALVHCTTDLEADWNHALGFTNTFIAPLGTTLPEVGSSVPLDRGRAGAPRTLLYVGRIYPVKALDSLIRAFALAVKEFSRGEHGDWVLRIVGPDQAGHMAELMSLCNQLHIPYTTPRNSKPLHLYTAKNSPRSPWQVEFAGPKFDQELDAEYENCTALALVSHTENFGATVIDTLAHSKPVITSTKSPWKIVADKHCGWWCSNEPEELAKTILQLFNSSSHQLSQMGANGRKLVEEQYTWPAIARNLISLYESVVHHD